MLFGSHWLECHHAQWLHAVLWDEPTMAPEPFDPLAPLALPLSSDGTGRDLHPPEHVLAVTNTSYRSGLGFYAFSERL